MATQNTSAYGGAECVRTRYSIILYYIWKYYGGETKKNFKDWEKIEIII